MCAPRVPPALPDDDEPEDNDAEVVLPGESLLAPAVGVVDVTELVVLDVPGGSGLLVGVSELLVVGVVVVVVGVVVVRVVTVVQMMLERTKKSSSSAPLACAVALSSVSLLGVTKPVPSSGVCVLPGLKGPE